MSGYFKVMATIMIKKPVKGTIATNIRAEVINDSKGNKSGNNYKRVISRKIKKRKNFTI